MEQAVQQAVGRQRIVQHLRGRQRRRQGERGAPGFLLRLLVEATVDATRARDLLQDQRRGAPATLGLRASQHHMARHLFRIPKILAGHGGERGALDRDDALVAVHVRALVAGEGQVALTQQRGRVRRRISFQQRLQPLGIRARIAAQRAGIGAVGQQHGDRALPLRLQAEGAAEFQRGGQPRCQRQRLAHQGGDDRVVAVPCQQRIGERAEAHEPPAHGLGLEVEGQHAARHHDVRHGRAVMIQKGGRGGRAGGHGARKPWAEETAP